MENRRGDDPGRRAEDDRWLKVQKDVMALVTATRDSQRGLANLEIEVGKLTDHVEDVDDHLRGVAGRESLDTRVSILEREFQMHGTLLRNISEQFSKLHGLMEDLKTDVTAIKIGKAISEKVESGRLEGLREWLKFWGPIIIASLALVVPLAKVTFDHWDKVRDLFHRQPVTAERIEQDIEKDRNGTRGKAVQKKLDAIERSRRRLE